jgi:class 3 adenylate cyclase
MQALTRLISAASLQKLSRQNYGPRIAGFTMLAVLVVLHDATIQHLSALQHSLLLVYAAVIIPWPFVAAFIAQKNDSSRDTEYKLIYTDSLIGGTGIGLLAFNLLPSQAILFALCANNMTVGGISLFVRGAGVMLLGIAFGWAASGFPIQLQSTLLIDTLSVIFIFGYVAFSNFVAYMMAKRLRDAKESIEEKNREIEKQSRMIATAHSELSYITEITNSVNSMLDASMIMERVLALLPRRFGFDKAGIQILDPGGTHLNFYGMYGNNITPEEREVYSAVNLDLNSRESISTLVVKKHLVIYQPRLTRQTDMLPLDREIYEVVPCSSILICPMEAATGIIGCISFFSTKYPTRLVQQDIEFMRRVIGQIANAINNTLLYEQSRNAERQLVRQSEEVKNAYLRLDLEMQKYMELLQNMLPASIAERLKNGERLIADDIPDATILFADLVGFTKLASGTTAAELVQMLNWIFSMFDEIVEVRGLEKIKTIGDAYMVAGGTTYRRTDHAETMLEAAMRMLDAVKDFSALTGMPLEVRIGLHTGSVVSGVIGTTKFAYDLWGDTVNIASRMESHGEPGKVNCSESVYLRVTKQDGMVQPTKEQTSTALARFEFQERGEIEIKGKGKMKTYFVVEKPQ